MKNLLKVGMIAFAFSLMFVGVDSVNAQRRQREERREYREEVRDARRDYRHDTGRRINRGRYYGNNNHRYNRPNYRIYYRNGRHYVVRY